MGRRCASGIHKCARPRFFTGQEDEVAGLGRCVGSVAKDGRMCQDGGSKPYKQRNLTVFLLKPVVSGQRGLTRWEGARARAWPASSGCWQPSRSPRAIDGWLCGPCYCESPGL